MGVYIELPKEWAKWSFDVRDIHDNVLEAKVTDLDLVRCGECKYQYMCGHQIKRNGLTLKLTCCEYGERRADEHTD